MKQLSLSFIRLVFQLSAAVSSAEKLHNNFLSRRASYSLS